MIITDDEAIELKSWVVKKLEDISDADSDVLADYVLALIRADTPEPELRLNAIENLEDFLKDNTAMFVDAIFRAIHSKSYLPGQDSQIPSHPVSPSFASPSAVTNSYPHPQNAPNNGIFGDVGQSRKRSFKERSDEVGLADPHYSRGDRQMKQIRRGGSRSGRADTFGGRGGRGGFQPVSSPNPSAGLTFPSLQIPPTGLPFDPNDPIAAMITMQAMGLPPFPGLPSLPQPTSPNLDQFGTQKSPLSGLPDLVKMNARCKDYDTKGYCTMGSSCPYEHGNDHMVAPGQDEYDPKNSVMMDIVKAPPPMDGNDASGRRRNNGVYRGAPRGRADRGGFVPSRRNRAEFSHSGPNHDASVTTVVVEQIPEDHFEERLVREFFSSFGNIEEITMQPYKRLAVVKYSDYASARKAYDSPKVIFNNRFVKVYWYKPELASTQSPNGNTPKGIQSSSKAEESPYDKEQFEQKAMAAQKKLDEKRMLMRDTEMKRQALEKQKEELARRQADEKKKLLEKLAAKGRSGDYIHQLNSEISDHNAGSANGADDSKVSAQTKALRAQVAALEAEAKSLGLDTALTEDPWGSRGRGRGRGRGSYRGWEGFAGRGYHVDSSRGNARGRGAFRGGRGGGAYNLDNRTRKVGVGGVEFDTSKDEALRQYLLGIGEFEAIESVPDRSDMQVVIFKDRFTAEQFIYGIKDIPGVGKVDLSWVNASSAAVRPNPKTLAQAGDTEIGDASVDGDGTDKGIAEVDYDVAEEDDRWMVE